MKRWNRLQCDAKHGSMVNMKGLKNNEGVVERPLVIDRSEGMSKPNGVFYQKVKEKEKTGDENSR